MESVRHDQSKDAPLQQGPAQLLHLRSWDRRSGVGAGDELQCPERSDPADVPHDFEPVAQVSQPGAEYLVPEGGGVGNDALGVHGPDGGDG